MKASELRIGNKLKKGGVVITVDAQTIVKIDDIGLAAGYEPIPLTPEWLERFGFKEIDGYWYKGFFALRNGEYFEIIDIWIAHVHQLQNLYFALTGEELELIKP